VEGWVSTILLWLVGFIKPRYYLEEYFIEHREETYIHCTIYSCITFIIN